jgi:hypothetical protein
MPRLVVFVACENVLISQNTNTASLIVLLNELTTHATLPDPLPPNAATPMKWYIFSEWEINDEDIGVRFDQKISMSGPNGEPVAGIENVSQFVPEQGKTIQRIVALLSHFPLLPAGRYHLNLSLLKAGEHEWKMKGEYPIAVSYRAANGPPIF